MENLSPQVTYTLKEKYFQVEPENRIRRYQYFIRSIVPVIIFAVLLGLVMSIFIPSLSIDFSSMNNTSTIIFAGAVILLSVVLYYCFYQFAKNNSIKRCHDFGNDGKIALIIIQVNFIISLIGLMVILLGIFDIFIDINLSEILDMFGNISGIAYFILWLFLLFRPGNLGENAYGPSPVNTKFSFLG